VSGEPPLPLFASYVNDGRMVNRVGLSRNHIFDAVQHSVRRLGTYIDVLQIHRMDPDAPYEEVMRALNDVIENGWVRYIGAGSVSISLTVGD
jgi:aryl-alcohol dehydrogenase-like predicted oxidoreductase